MATDLPDLHRARPSTALRRQDNVGANERWISALAGVSLALRALKGRGTVGRLMLVSAGMSLLVRGATGYCALKSSWAGQTTLRDGIREQLERLRDATGVGASGSIDSMEALYAAELQELHSAECQLTTLTERLVPTIQNPQLAIRFDEYVTELRARKVDLESLLARSEIEGRAHPDDAMRALLGETEKMARLCGPALRDVAVTASLQRIMHYKIAGYGTIAAYAKSLGRNEEAAHFAELSDRDKTIDTELSRLAKAALNPEAVVTPEPKPAGSVRTH
jgi:ferritin-like metal-binding protein YciE